MKGNKMKKSEIRNDPGISSYFQGGYRGYGRYQWNIKYYNFESEFEVEVAQFWVFGNDFDAIKDLLDREVECSIAGRSGGWFVIDTELTKKELKLIDAYIKSCLKHLPKHLKEWRESESK